MKTNHRWILASALALVFDFTALAGPPMICHPLDIGGEKSLPWTNGVSWDAKLPGYDTSRLVANTLELLTPSTPVIARMETLRRAVIYTQGKPELAKELSRRLMERTQGSSPDSVALFDAGYFIEATHQYASYSKADPLAGMDGYLVAKKSLTGTKEVAAVEFGLSLMKAHTEWPNDHYRNAVVGAKEGSLLAANLLRQANQTSLANLRATALARR